MSMTVSNKIKLGDAALTNNHMANNNNINDDNNNNNISCLCYMSIHEWTGGLLIIVTQ